MAFKGILVDDDPRAGEAARRFSSSQLDIQFCQPGALEDFSQQIFDGHPNIVILDYRLDEHAGPGGVSAKYRASALAQQFRDLASSEGDVDFPIVLHSAENNIRTLFQPEKTSHDLFDEVIKKGVKKDELRISERLGDLAAGYAMLISSRPYRSNLSTLFAVPKDRSDLIDFQEIRRASETTIPHIFARFILQKLIARSGMLADREVVCARAGIAISDDSSWPTIEAALAAEGAKYSGIFGGGNPRWWRTLVDEAIEKWTDAPIGRLDAVERTTRLSRALRAGINPAHSTWNQSANEVFTHSCAICRNPTLVAQSLSAHEPLSGSLLERRRICFDCIASDRHLGESKLAIDELDSELERSIRSGEIQRD